MRNEGLGSWPARRARKTPDRTALVHEGRSWTYAELHTRVLRLAGALRAAGVRRGDRIAHVGPNHPSYLETLFAAGALGAIFVPLNFRLAVPELAAQLADCGARLLVHAPTHADVPADRRIEIGPAYEEFLATGEPEPRDEPVALADTCMIMYTSGTTGRAKGAMLTHGNLTWNAFNVLVDQDLRADEVALVSAPLFHTAGLNMLTLPVLLKGGTCVIASAFDPGGTLTAIEEHGVTYMFGVPTMFQRVADHPRFPDADLSSVRLLNCGGAPVPPALIEVYGARGLTFAQGYGMTEAAAGTLMLAAEDTATRAGSAGKPHFFTDVRAVTPDGREAAPGEVGEVVVSGPNVIPGYWNDPEATANAFDADGFFRSGDAARVDADGYFHIVDRIKDMFISGGENVYPAEVEKALSAHPDVLDCAVFGVPDATWGEVGRAVVVPRPGSGLTERDVLEALQGRLAKYKIPKSVAFARAVPRNAAGKILRASLRTL